MKTISVANQKGGCGKTTTAINMASALAELDKKVLLIDLDPQAHASFGLGVTSQSMDASIYNVMTDNEAKKRAITGCIKSVSKNLAVVPSNILLSTLEQELKDKEDAVSKLHQAITAQNLDYDYVIIDCPPSLGFLTFNALRAADHIIVPLDMSAFSLMGVSKLLGMLELIKMKISHAPRVSALATLFDKRTKYCSTMLDEIKTYFKDQMLTTVIRVSVALKKAAAKGISVVQFDDKSNGAIDYMELGRELLRIDNSAELDRAIAEVEAENAAKEAVFAINAPAARDIYVVGDFNHCKINDDSRLSKDEDGKWIKKLGLQPGRYKYKFVVDGEWLLDSENQEKEPNTFGTFDSIKTL